jgi:hypothetical protein
MGVGKTNKIFITFVLVTALLGCATALDVEHNVEMRPGEAAFENLYYHGIGQPWVGGNPPWQQNQDESSSGGDTSTSKSVFFKYSQFYTLHDDKSKKIHIEPPKKHEIKDEMPTTIYFSYQMDPIPYSQYQTYSTYTGGNSLWIQGDRSWTQYAVIPQGAGISLLANTQSGGSGTLFEITPNGQLLRNAYTFYPGSNQINFYADTVGQHILLFVIGSSVSSSVIIDVAPNQPQTYY